MRRRNTAMAERRTQTLQVLRAAMDSPLSRNFDIRLECPADRLRFENF